jgi:hypothetical protein
MVLFAKILGDKAAPKDEIDVSTIARSATFSLLCLEFIRVLTPSRTAYSAHL